MKNRLGRRLLVALVVLVLVAPAHRTTAAPVDTWRILHVGLQSAASADTDGDGTINTWTDALRRKWQIDVACLDPILEGWSGGKIDVTHKSVFLRTSKPVRNNPYDFRKYGFDQKLEFERYDVVMVWTAYTQNTGNNGGATWNGAIGSYAFIRLNGVAGACPDPVSGGPWPASVPAHEFTHAASGLYWRTGFRVCNIYDFREQWQAVTGTTYLAQVGRMAEHRAFYRNAYPWPTNAQGVKVPVHCDGVSSSRGIPSKAWSSGSWADRG